MAGFWHAGHFNRVKRREIATHPATQQPMTISISPNGASDPLTDLYATATERPTNGQAAHQRKKFLFERRT